MSYQPVTLNLPAGFEIKTKEELAAIPKRLIATIQKRQKHGGTHLSLTWPGPIGYFNFDKDITEDVLIKFADKKQIAVKSYALGVDITKMSKENIQEKAKETIEMFQNDFDVMLNSGVRSIIIDTETEMYQYKRLADFGKLEKVLPELYGPLNQWFRSLMDRMKTAGINLALLERLKKEYEGRDWTGKYTRSGFSEAPFLVQANVTVERLEYQNPAGSLPFELTVMDSSQNPNVKGLKLQSDPATPAAWDALTGIDAADRAMTQADQCNFPWLAVSVFPDTKLKDWV